MQYNPMQSIAFNQFSALLCGLNGFAEFVEENWIEKIVSWQNETTGCYEYFGRYPIESERRKRSVQVLDDNCSDHMSGLAAGLFGLLAKILHATE